VLSGAAGALPWLQDTADPAPGYRRLGVARRFLDAALPAGDSMAPMAPDIVQERPNAARAPAPWQLPNLRAIALGRDDLALAYCYEWPAGAVAARDKPAPPPAGLRISGVREGGFAAETWDCATGAVVQRQTLKAGAAAENASGRNLATLLVEALWSGEDIALKIVRQPAKP
jgi:hypothetical protein